VSKGGITPHVAKGYNQAQNLHAKERGKDPARHDKETDRKIRSNEKQHVKREEQIRYDMIERRIDR
jgi:hypothetical protein